MAEKVLYVLGDRNRATDTNDKIRNGVVVMVKRLFWQYPERLNEGSHRARGSGTGRSI